jgi:hypothetical protein
MAELSNPLFWTERGIPVPAVTAEQMREVDRIAVQEFGLGILQMMENAGRNLAQNVMDWLGGVGEEVTILAAAISLARAAELLDLPWLDLRTRCLRLDVPLRMAQARKDVQVTEAWTRPTPQ